MSRSVKISEDRQRPNGVYFVPALASIKKPCACALRVSYKVEFKTVGFAPRSSPPSPE